MTIEQKLNKEVATLFAAAVPRFPARTRRRVTYNEMLSDTTLMIDAISHGIPYSLFDLIQNVAPFSQGDWAAILNISPKSLQRYKQDKKAFKSSQSEKIVEVAEVTKRGKEVFGDAELFKEWMNSRIIALGNVKPIELMTDSYGIRLVMRTLTNIEHGIFA